jgi:maleamate amidohydrolase
MDDKGQLAAYEGINMGVGSIGPGERPAIVVVDLQRQFTEGKLASPRTDGVMAATAELLEKGRELGVPVIFLRCSYDSDDQVGLVWKTKCPDMAACVPGTAATEIDPRLTVLDGEPILDKHRASGFFRTELDDLLQRNSIDTVILAGTSTSGCVRATAVDGAMRDYRTIIVEDCVDDRADGSHHATLTDFHAKYGEVMKLEDLLAALAR